MTLDILIVGAGPVGLFLANECARRGLRYRILEERAAQSEHSKALAIFPRTLEVFDMAGLEAPFLECANRVTSVAVITHGEPLAHMHFAPEESPYPFIAMVPQDVTEKLLLDSLRGRGGVVEYQTVFASAIEEGNVVNATVLHNGKEEHILASFIVGCDGAHSAVRHDLKLPFEGGEYQQAFLLADIETNSSVPADEMQLCPSELGPLAIFPMSATRRRIVATIDRQEGTAPSLDLVQRMLSDRAPIGLEARALHWSSYFRIHHRVTIDLRRGRIFLAGDAAHIHSPFGGQGMNTGLQDAWNLIWKLDFILRGHGNEQLLESYGAERLPVIKQVIETTDRLTRVMATPSKFMQAIRNTVIPMVSHLSPFQHAFVDRLSELGIAYGGSPLIEGPGKRYLEDSMRGGSGIRSSFLLLIHDDEAIPLKSAAQQLCANFNRILEFRSSPKPGITLVRPDGYIAYETRSHDTVASLDAVRSVLERQILT